MKCYLYTYNSKAFSIGKGQNWVRARVTAVLNHILSIEQEFNRYLINCSIDTVTSCMHEGLSLDLSTAKIQKILKLLKLSRRPLHFSKEMECRTEMELNSW